MVFHADNRQRYVNAPMYQRVLHEYVESDLHVAYWVSDYPIEDAIFLVFAYHTTKAMAPDYATWCPSYVYRGFDQTDM